MNHNHILSLLQTGFTTIRVTFDLELQDADPVQRARNRNNQNRDYTYKALLEDNLKVGDLVLVDSPSTGVCVVLVTGVDEKPKIDLSAPFSYKWIIQKVDRTRYDSLLEQEEKFRDALVEVERVKQREEVLKGFQQHLPEGSEARKMFEQTIEAAKVLPHVG